MTSSTRRAASWAAGVAILCCVAILLRAYGARNMQHARRAANMLHNIWNTELPGLAF